MIHTIQNKTSIFIIYPPMLTNMEPRTSPVVEVSDKNLTEFTDLQIGSRVLAALANTPVEGTGNYHAIVVAKNADTISMTPEEVLDNSYDTILRHRINRTDEWREKVGSIVREKLQEADHFILGRS